MMGSSEPLVGPHPSGAGRQGASRVGRLARWLDDACAGRHGRFAQIGLVTLALLIALRVLAPFVLVAWINHRLGEGETLHGRVGGLSLGLLRGSYDVERIDLTARDPVTGRFAPLLSISDLQCDLSWSALAAGRLEGSIRIVEPLLHLGPPAVEPGKEASKAATGEEWRSMIGKLARFRIAAIVIDSGVIAYDDDHRGVHATVGSIDGRVDDLVVPTGTHRPARFDFSGSTTGRGKLRLTGTARALPEKPQLILRASLTEVDLPALSPLTARYDGLVFRAGSFSGYLELNLDGDLITGSFKPIFHDLDVSSYKTKDSSAATALFWAAVVPIAEFVLKNRERDQHAAIIPINGVVSDPQTDYWTIAGTALGNAFVRAILPGFDGMPSAAGKY